MLCNSSCDTYCIAPTHPKRTLKHLLARVRVGCQSSSVLCERIFLGPAINSNLAVARPAVIMSSPQCKWKATEGCQNPRKSARVPKNDLNCDKAPGPYSAGYCMCADNIPRYFGCNQLKKPCRQACDSPLPKSTLTSVLPPCRTTKATKKRTSTTAPTTTTFKQQFLQKWLPTITIGLLIVTMFMIHVVYNRPQKTASQMQKELRERIDNRNLRRQASAIVNNAVNAAR